MSNILDSKNIPNLPKSVVHTGDELQEIMFNGMYIYPIGHTSGSYKVRAQGSFQIVDETLDNSSNVGPKITVVSLNEQSDNTLHKKFVNDLCYGLKCIALSEDDRNTAIEEINKYIASNEAVKLELKQRDEELSAIFNRLFDERYEEEAVNELAEDWDRYYS